MRRRRLKVPEGYAVGIYHCVSRVVDRRKVLGEAEKEHFVRLMRMYERLYGLQVITFCLMANHFHILVAVPSRPEVLPDDAALVALVRESQGKGPAQTLAHWLSHWRKTGNAQAAEKERERWFKQMWDVSQFMKVLKQRFSQWFNGRGPVRRKGTLWEERFRSVLVEDGEALHAIAAYIDLNPVRAGLVADPKDYRWCGYGEACAGKKLARHGLLRAAKAADPTRSPDSGFDLLAWYREQLFGRGTPQHDSQRQLKKHGFTQKQIETVLAQKGHLPRHLYLRLRLRSFTEGALIGSKAFLEDVFRARRAWFGPKRKSASRRLHGLHPDDPLRAARDLTIDPTG